MPPIDRRQALTWTLATAAGAASAALGLGPAHAQAALPEVAKIIVGFPPGGAPDLIARRLSDQLAGKLARAVVIDNRPGAAGRIAIDIARQSPPDGLTLLLNPAGVLTVNPHTYKKLNYDPAKDFTPIGLAAQVDFGFGIGPGVPAEVKTLAAFADWARTQPGKVTYGSPAAGAPPHFVGEAMNSALGLGMTHVPYRGATPALNDLMGGQISALVLTLGDLVENAKAGRVRLLASSGPARSKFTPAVPTFTEQGVPGLELRDWFAIYIAGTATPEVAARVGSLLRGVTASPAYVQALANSSLEAGSSTPQELERMAQRDLALWAPIVKASGFVADV